MAERVPKKILINDECESFYFSSPSSSIKKRKLSNASRNTSAGQKIVSEKLETPSECLIIEENVLATEVPEIEILETEKQLDSQLSYVNLLVTSNCITPVDESYQAFVLPDFDTSSCSLKDGYLIVNRRLIKFLDSSISWLYYCSCDQIRSRVINLLPQEVARSVKNDIPSPCIHVNGLKSVIEGFDDSLESEYEKRVLKDIDDDDHCYDKTPVKTDIYPIEGHDHVVCIKMTQHGKSPSYSIVKIDFTGHKPVFVCSSCPKKTEDCSHVTALKSQGEGVSDITEEGIIRLLNEKPKWRSKYVPVAVSTDKVQFSLEPEDQKKSRCTYLKEKQKEDGYTYLSPEISGHCACNLDWNTYTNISDEIPVFLYYDVLAAKVSYLKCDVCHTKKYYDGGTDSILNMGSYMVSHELLRKYLRQFITEGTPLIAFYQELCWSQIESGNLEFRKKFSYNRFRYAWYSFLELLDIDYINGFHCPDCGDTPSTVVMDGVALGIKKTFMPWKDHIKKQSRTNSLDGSSHNVRVFVNNKRCRYLINKFILTGLSEDLFTELLNAVELYQPSLLPFFLDFKEVNADTFKCPEIFIKLFKCLSSNYPVCAFLHYNERLFDIISLAAAGHNLSTNVKDILFVDNECPVLASLLHLWKWSVPKNMQPILLELVKKAKVPYATPVHSTGTCEDNCQCPGHSFFPTLPVLHHRGDYIMDSKNKKVPSQCSKKGTSHNKLIPGLFTVSCIHGICYGFQLMEDVESPNVPFTILRTRFHSAPKLIVYDNACNLQNYCLNRDPSFFRDSWFVVDRFHWFNHTGCHSGYNLSTYHQFADINTQVAEQRNSTLRKLKSSLSYMNFKNFNNHLKLFIWFRSIIHLMQIKPDISFKDSKFFKNILPIYSKHN